MDTQTVARLELTGAEWVALCQAADFTAPDGFGPPDELGEEALAVAEQQLIDKELLVESGLHPWVAVHLLVWSSPDALVQTEVSMGERGLRGVYAMQGPLGVSLFTLPEGAVELSMFQAVDLGVELQRCVPAIPPEVREHNTISRLVPDAAPAPIKGRVPLAALTDGTVPGFEPGAEGVNVTEAEADLAAALTARTVGVLNCLVVGGPDGDRPALAASVVWFATDAGWVGVNPSPDGSGRQLVDLVPVDREAIGGWLAPYLARILEAADG